jgi:hypothetical protein
MARAMSRSISSLSIPQWIAEIDRTKEIFKRAGSTFAVAARYPPNFDLRPLGAF